MIREFNKKLEQDPGYILPEGYKKVTDKNMIFEAKIRPKAAQGLPQSYLECSEVLDDLVFSILGFHTLELTSSKTTKSRARPNVFVNVNSKLMEKT